MLREPLLLAEPTTPPETSRVNQGEPQIASFGHEQSSPVTEKLREHPWNKKAELAESLVQQYRERRRGAFTRTSRERYVCERSNGLGALRRMILMNAVGNEVGVIIPGEPLEIELHVEVAAEGVEVGASL